MKKRQNHVPRIRNRYLRETIWLLQIILGTAIFALGFDMFLLPNGINAGGLSGLAMIFVHLTNVGSVGVVTFIVNVPLFILGWRSIGRRFFVGSLIGAFMLSFWMEVFIFLPVIEAEPVLGALYGGILCGAGGGLVYASGASTGGSDIINRLLKKKWRNVPIGKIVMGFDSCVVVLTAIAFRDAATILYCGITIYACSKLVDAVVYSFDYSKVAIIISAKHDEIAAAISEQLDRGATFLYGQGVYSGQDTKVVLTAVKKQELADLKKVIITVDPDAFIILQESHQVLGEGFVRYSDNSL